MTHIEWFTVDPGDLLPVTTEELDAVAAEAPGFVRRVSAWVKHEGRQWRCRAERAEVSA